MRKQDKPMERMPDVLPHPFADELERRRQQRAVAFQREIEMRRRRYAEAAAVAARVAARQVVERRRAEAARAAAAREAREAEARQRAEDAEDLRVEMEEWRHRRGRTKYITYWTARHYHSHPIFPSNSDSLGNYEEV
jgi:hypothetical protein